MRDPFLKSAECASVRIANEPNVRILAHTPRRYGGHTPIVCEAIARAPDQHSGKSPSEGLVDTCRGSDHLRRVGGTVGEGGSPALRMRRGGVMNNNNPSSDEQLRKELNALGAREYEIVALTMDSGRGLAALRYALGRGVDHPLPYAIKIFDNPDWHPAGEKKRQATNVSVEKNCPHCGGHRFVAVLDDWRVPYGETYAPCKQCNASANTEFWSATGERRVAVPQ